MMAKKLQEREKSFIELLSEQGTKGTEVKIPGSERLIRLKVLDAPELLREGKMPDILTPLVIKSIYQDLSDKEVREFIGQPRGGATDALALMETMDYVCTKAIADGTKVKELTIGEKRWIFRLALSSAELLVTFRYDPNADVESVDEGDEVPEVTQ